MEWRWRQWNLGLLHPAAAAAVLLLTSACSACQPPFSVVNGVCVFIDTENRLRWCDAASRCLEMGGELLTDIDSVRAVRLSFTDDERVWIGVTDLLIERGTNRSGWRFTDGSVLPTLGDDDWVTGKPDSKDVDDDFVFLKSSGLQDNRYHYNRGFACQPIRTVSSFCFRQQQFLQLGNVSPTYCYTDAPAQHEFSCVQRCAHRWQCRSALHNSVLNMCRMIDFADASVGDEIENNPNWKRFVKIY
jgi:hypothetical protein